MGRHDDEFQEIGHFYDASEITKFWNQLKQQHMHVGYWDADHPFTNDLLEGAIRFTNYMIDHVAIAEGQSFIDIGCGYGVPGAYLARQKKCNVWGITASKQQKMFADSYILQNKLEKQLQVQVADARHLPFKDSIFGGGWFFESIFHIGHEQALLEAGRVLKANAELLIADFIKTRDFSEEETNFMNQEVGITSLVSIDEYPTLMDRAGFTIVDAKDITEHTIDAERKWQVHLQIIERNKGTWKNPETYVYLKDFFSKLHEIGKHGLEYYLIKARKL